MDFVILHVMSRSVAGMAAIVLVNCTLTLVVVDTKAKLLVLHEFEVYVHHQTTLKELLK